MLANFHAGSMISGASSQFDVAAGYLSKYRAIVEEVKDKAIHLDDLVNKFPLGTEARTNPRYCTRRLDKDAEN